MRKKNPNTVVYSPEVAADFKYKVAFALYDTLEERAPRSEAAQVRFEVAREYLERGLQDWTIGRLFELVCMAPRSKKAWVAAQGKTDCYVKIRKPNGKIEYAPAEAKTGGGRVGFLEEKNCPRYVVYMLIVCNKSVPAGRLVLPVVMTSQRFEDLLFECGAVKSTNGKHPEVAIQVSNKPLYEALVAYGEETGMWFDPERVYNPEDFD